MRRKKGIVFVSVHWQGEADDLSPATMRRINELAKEVDDKMEKERKDSRNLRDRRRRAAKRKKGKNSKNK